MCHPDVCIKLTISNGTKAVFLWKTHTCHIGGVLYYNIQMDWVLRMWTMDNWALIFFLRSKKIALILVKNLTWCPNSKVAFLMNKSLGKCFLRSEKNYTRLHTKKSTAFFSPKGVSIRRFFKGFFGANVSWSRRARKLV